MLLQNAPRVTAMLGPTNTGKTHYAIERMLAHRTGVIGLPLRLLAREVYDRIVRLRGPSVVALVTGEERIVPARTAFWVCTVEAMPLDILPDFLAVDEIQLAADPDRGHVFTNRLLHARGLKETLFLGSDTMRARIASLVPGAQFLRRERFSQLRYSGPRKISRLPARSAVVGFSVEDVYAIGELIRRQKGGVAVVMGALSPRTRNAQVELYQNGDVDYLVATDAIGMGLNLDITHVAFSSVVKFDGRRHRQLEPAELGQIAGRAGRYTTDGGFGVTGEAGPLDPEVIEAIENHRFAPVGRLHWRNPRLDFGSPDALIASLEAPSAHVDLQRAREADDLATLRALTEVPEIRTRLRDARDMRLLWDVCQIPDFRKVSPAEHASLAARLHGYLKDGGGIPTDWLARQIQRIDRNDGDIDALSKRLAYIRTWTYVAQRRAWVDDADHWREETRAVEDRLSDALHARLTQRFVDRRTSVLMRRLKQKEGLVATVTESGDVSIDDQFIGRLEGFRFRLDPSADAEQAKTLRLAGIAALAPALNLRADKFYNAPDPEIDVTEQGGLMWGEYAVGKLVAGSDALSPQVAAFVDEDAPPEIGEKVRRRLGHWIDRRITALFQPLIALRDDEALAGMARGIGFRLVEALGVLPRGEVADDVKSLDQDGRASLRKHGVRFGQYTVFQPLMLKPAPTRLRLVLWALKDGLDEFPSAPPPGLVTVPAAVGAPAGYYPRAGYRLAGDRAIRIDMLERLADILRGLDAQTGFEASPDMLSITGLGQDQFARLMQGLGYVATPGARPKRKPGQTAAASPPGADADTRSPPADVAATSADDPGGAIGEADAGQATSDGGAIGAGPLPLTAEAETQEADADVTMTMPAAAEPAEPAEPAEQTGEAPSPGEPQDASFDAFALSAAEGEPRAEGETKAEAEAEPASEAAAIETEVFYTFARAPRRRPERGTRDARPPRAAAKGGGDRGENRTPDAQRRDTETREGEKRGAGNGEGEKREGEKREGEKREGEKREGEKREGDRARGKRRRGEGEGKPKGKPAEADKPAPKPRYEKPIDPDNPFAALMALKTRG